MSTNGQSRRVFITAGTAALAGGASVGALASAVSDPAEAAFAHWLHVIARHNTLPDPSDANLDAHWPHVVAAEVSIRTLTPSPAALAAFTLVQLSYELLSSARPSEFMPRLSRQDEDFADYATLFHGLACLRSSLTGCIGRMATDLLDNPERPAGESLLFRAKSGRA